MEHPSGSLAKELLEAGLARVVDWSMNFLPVEEVSTLRGAELEAKKQHLRLWKDWVEVNVSDDGVEGSEHSVCCNPRSSVTNNEWGYVDRLA